MKQKKIKTTELTHGNIPATVGLVHEVRNELKADIRALDRKTEAGFKRVDVRFTEMDGKLAEMMSLVHGTKVLMEEQRAENRIVLDGLKTVLDRQDRVETEVSSLRETAEGFRTRTV